MLRFDLCCNGKITFHNNDKNHHLSSNLLKPCQGYIVEYIYEIFDSAIFD